MDPAASRSLPKRSLSPLRLRMALCCLKPGSKLRGDSSSTVPPISLTSPQNRARLHNQFIKQTSEELSFSQEVLQQWGFPGIPFSQYRFDQIYNTKEFITVHEFKARKAPKLKSWLPPSIMELPSLPTLPPSSSRSAKIPKKHKLRKLPKKLASPSDTSALSSTSPVSEILDSQTTILSSAAEWGLEQRETWLRPSEKETRGWENLMLKKLNKRTARWILNKLPPRPGVPPSKWQSFLKHQYDWSHIRDELSSASDLELLAQLEAEEMAEYEGGMETISAVQEEKKPELLLPVYFRIPSYIPPKKRPEIMAGYNKTVDDIISECNLFRSRLSEPPRQMTSRAGEYAYSTDNAFEQDIYFDLVQIIHQKDVENEILLENQHRYYKHLPKVFPKSPEEWNHEQRPLKFPRPKKGAFRWTSLPTPAKELMLTDENTVSTKIRRGKKEVITKLEEDVPWETKILRNILQDWKTAWIIPTQWKDATVEGLVRNLKSVQDWNRTQAIITCATAALERPRFQETLEDNEEEKVEEPPVEEVPKELQPLLKEALMDRKFGVRVAAALFYYSIQAHNHQAQEIMQDALRQGNDADSWAAAQCLALDGIASFPVIKRILRQLFRKKDKETEEQACILLSHLSDKTTLIHTLLAVELNSCQWQVRIVACRALSRITGRSVNKDLKYKLVQLMWNDWNLEVRQAAAQALGQMKLGKEVHDKIWTMLGEGNSQDRVEALSLIGWLKLMTAKLLPGFLNCFSDDFMAVRREACLAAASLRIKDRMVFDCLLKLVQGDPYWKIKAFAIKALGNIGYVNPQLTDLLLWALHYEEEPGVRLEACRSITALKIKDDKVRDTFLDVLLLESHEAVLMELSEAIKNLDFQDEGNQEMLQKIKKRIVQLSKKNLISDQIMKIEEIANNLRQETKYIFLSRPRKDKPSEELVDFFKDAFKCKFPRESHIYYLKASPASQRAGSPCTLRALSFSDTTGGRQSWRKPLALWSATASTGAYCARRLQNEGFNVIVVRGKTLGAWWNSTCHTTAEKACGHKRRKEQPSRYSDQAMAGRALPGGFSVSRWPFRFSFSAAPENDCSTSLSSPCAFGVRTRSGSTVSLLIFSFLAPRLGFSAAPEVASTFSPLCVVRARTRSGDSTASLSSSTATVGGFLGEPFNFSATLGAGDAGSTSLSSPEQAVGDGALSGSALRAEGSEELQPRVPRPVSRHFAFLAAVWSSGFLFMDDTGGLLQAVYSQSRHTCAVHVVDSLKKKKEKIGLLLFRLGFRPRSWEGSTGSAAVTYNGGLGRDLPRRLTGPKPNPFTKSFAFDQKIPGRLTLNKRLKTIREKRVAKGPFAYSRNIPKTE
ncbi:HEAT repeat-containing protein 4 [Gracilinanus agilis]|uniref:HEAT repeat-containing protein 4 n=1 Tax=Gracilinanus agilis TaxID=191870 RepID=UPI001CFC9C59|nr:HEAT repeat-containing protein 4 [Gracilinanus agilis]